MVEAIEVEPYPLDNEEYDFFKAESDISEFLKLKPKLVFR